MESKKLTWEEMKKLYDQEWVELVDYDWPEEEVNPRAGVVRVHSSDRTEFYRLAAVDTPRDSAIVFVGKRKLPDGVIFSPGARRVVAKHA
ncbi:MAG: hypothetical protein DCC75_10470 [Proteobacteria bacterium]|nr:MAG: hypothetical protein DCC75_10470 [Pseudomonadota bacterium]